MAEAKRQHDWNVASSVMALTAEINRDRKRRRKAFQTRRLQSLHGDEVRARESNG
jgi:hypothetical protein